MDVKYVDTVLYSKYSKIIKGLTSDLSWEVISGYAPELKVNKQRILHNAAR